MTRRQIHIGSVYEIDIRGRAFPARVRCLPPKLVGIDPLIPNISYRHCSTRQVRKRLDQQERLA